MSKDLQIAKKFVSLEKSAKKRGLDLNLSLTSLRNIFKAKKCFYTGTTFVQKEGNIHSRTIDRVNNTKGYVTGNVVACTFEFNSRKGGITPEDIKILMRKVL